jgi:D-hydroxyproline dehydrogenase subunit beta
VAGGPTDVDVVVVGAGIVGSCTALALVEAGLSVCVVDRGGPAGGTTSAGEGNLLVSDKLPGPELALAQRSLRRWAELADALGGFEHEPKGGLVVAADEAQLAALRATAAQQAAAGVEVEHVAADALHEHEPLLAPRLAGGVRYPQDAQVQPMLAVQAVLGRARRQGAEVRCYTTLSGVGREADGRHRLTTSSGVLRARDVVLATGPWTAEAAALFGARSPVRPRRGHILVTEPLGPVVRSKVYEADYVAAVASDEATAQCSAVVEATPGGTVLIGSSRELVGFDPRPAPDVLAELARRAVRLFPFLAEVRAIRSYLGFRPASPDHLPIIGPDPDVAGLHHATGHEGAGIGLAPATAELVAACLTGAAPAVDPAPFDPGRFPRAEEAAARAG